VDRETGSDAGWDGAREVPLDDELLPDRTVDELDVTWGDRSTGSDDLAWYLSERPPHHGDDY
jgi:hypothetical protein